MSETEVLAGILEGIAVLRLMAAAQCGLLAAIWIAILVSK